MQWYLLIGLLYAIVNITIRKIDYSDNWTLVFVWIFIWPIAFLALLINYLFTFKIKNNQNEQT